jgi:hypothetical protein
MKHRHLVIAHFLLFSALHSSSISFVIFILCLFSVYVLILPSVMNNFSSQTSKFGSSLASAPIKQSFSGPLVLTYSPTSPDASTVFPLPIQIFTTCYSSTSKTEAVCSSEMNPFSTLHSVTSKKPITLSYGALRRRTNFA